MTYKLLIYRVVIKNKSTWHYTRVWAENITQDIYRWAGIVFANTERVKWGTTASQNGSTIRNTIKPVVQESQHSSFTCLFSKCQSIADLGRKFYNTYHIRKINDLLHLRSSGEPKVAATTSWFLLPSSWVNVSRETFS